MPADQSDAPIEIRDLTKNFGAVRALDGLDLTVHGGEVHGFLGPNGAGKSTTIRILLGLVKADAGTVRLFGADPWTDGVDLHRQIAYVPGDVTLWPSMTGGEIIDLLARMRGGIDERRRADLIERFELDPHKKARTYSIAILIAGLAAGLAYGTAANNIGGKLPMVLGTAAAQLPAVWLPAAVTVALFGLLPRFTSVAWAVLVAFVALYLLGSLSGAWQWLLDLEPFTHPPGR
jgi:hypothetical protein